VRAIRSEDAQALDAMVARRRQIIGMLTQEKIRLGFELKPVQKGTEKHPLARALIRGRGRRPRARIRNSPVSAAKSDLL